MALSKKDFRAEASRLRNTTGRNKEVQIKTAARIFRASNPRFSESRFRSFIKYGTENKRDIAKMKKRK